MWCDVRPIPTWPNPNTAKKNCSSVLDVGDARAFEWLYDVAGRRAGLLRQMLTDEREAEDMLQDAASLVPCVGL